jgi:hypothetical protein
MTSDSVPVPCSRYENLLIQNQLQEPFTSFAVIISGYKTAIFPVSDAISKARLSEYFHLVAAM